MLRQRYHQLFVAHPADRLESTRHALGVFDRIDSLEGVHDGPPVYHAVRGSCYHLVFTLLGPVARRTVSRAFSCKEGRDATCEGSYHPPERCTRASSTAWSS